MMKRIVMVMVACLAIMPAGTIRAAEVADRVVAVVNNDVITLFELNNTVNSYVGKIPQSYGKQDREKIIAEARTAILNRMIDDVLVEQESKKSGIIVKEDDVMASIEDLLSRRKMKLEDFKQALIRDGSNFERYKEEVRKHLMKLRLAQKEVRAKIAVSDEEIGKYYSEHRDVYEGKEAVKLKQILLALPQDADEETREKLKLQAEAVLKKLKSGEPFELAAAQYSQGPAAREGGDLGFVEKGTMLPAVDEAAFKLKVGELSDVIESPMGFHILKVTDRRGKGAKSLSVVREEIKEEIANEKMDKKLQEWLQELRKKSFIETRL